MKILVFSDSHGSEYYVEKMISDNPNAELMIFLGDGASDVQELSFASPEKAFIGLKGNCDYFCTFPNVHVFKTDNVRFFCTHGHMHQVKSGLYLLKKAALENNADIALFGHTHVQMTKEEDGIIFLNPGSLKNGDYALIETNSSHPRIFLRHL